MRYLFLMLSFIGSGSFAQISVSPEFPSADEEITIIYDATQGTSALQGAAKVLMHAGAVLSGPSALNWEHVQGNWGDPGSVGEMTSLGGNRWEIKITPRSYFDVPEGIAIYRIGMVFRSAGPCGGFAGNNTLCKEGKSLANGDIFVDLYEADELHIKVTEPGQFPLFVNAGEALEIRAAVSRPSRIQLIINGIIVLDETNATNISYSHTATSALQAGHVAVVADDGTKANETSFNYIVRATVVDSPRPIGIRPGITYLSSSAATVCLWAPMKTSVYVIGDFTQWKIDPQYLMKKDGEYFWLELTGLEAGKEYPFQYLVDETFYVADPFADKILDPDDQHIPNETYPDLIQYPAKALKDEWYYNRLSVLQTGQNQFNWSDTTFQKPPKENLIIYELLVRDFFADGERNYQNLIDTLGYLKRLGVNAIELMPITEFNGNESWGYNPTFMFAPDKYYGTKIKLKEFIDRCHAEGIAVILDVVMNQQDIPNPFVLMYYDFDLGKPTAESPWFNQDATHPFNVFFDLNHESTYTQQYLDTVNHYWIHEYHFDGYRFDLSKGFTQTNSGGNVSAWGEYDASRIATLKRMADKIWEHTPDAYVILEHFANNDEEKELAEYRSDEGKGMMLWGNYNGQYSQNSTGGGGADFSSIYHLNREWSVPHLIGYMESHDEERLMYRNLQTGRSVGSYNIKTLETALERMKAVSMMLYTIPGPKMIWQFGELGYDQSINRCEDGRIEEGCRVSPKPVHWDYREDAKRYDLYKHVAELLDMRNKYPVFTKGGATIQEGSSFVKQASLKNKPFTSSPTDATQMNVALIANFDAIGHTAPLNVSHAGNWYEFYTGQVISVAGTSYSMTLRPGEYRLYTDVPLNDAITAIEEELTTDLIIYPNPVRENITIEDVNVKSINFYTPEGKEVFLKRVSYTCWNTQGLASGLYIVRIETQQGVRRAKIVKQ